MNTLRKLWICFISNSIWVLEKNLFYPKLRFTYNKLLLSAASDFHIIFDVGANKGQTVSFLDICIHWLKFTHSNLQANPSVF